MPWKGSESGENHGTDCDMPVGGGSDEIGDEYFAAQCIWKTLAASWFLYLRYSSIVLYSLPASFWN